MKAIASVAASALVAATLAEGGSTEVVRAPVNVSIGEQPIDLQRAVGDGAR